MTSGQTTTRVREHAELGNGNGNGTGNGKPATPADHNRGSVRAVRDDAAPDHHAATDDAVELSGLVHRQIELLGEDPERAGLRRTPERVSTALTWLTRGYTQNVADVVGNGVFEESHENMVLVRDIEMYSLCEHHMLPFFGKAHIAYIPDRRILGLSKIPRIVEVFARRLQVQERLTDEIADAIMEVLEPRGVGVVIEAQHLCMMMRGIQKQNSSTVTSALRGEFRDCPMTREEFLRLAHGSGS
ncbi:MAG: GTP cyclohydrolase I FolE [Longimicrobiales bacterium]